MKKWQERLVSVLCVTASLLPLFGCAKEEEPRGVGAMGSEVWETMPALTYGEMEYEKLQVLDWNSGRCEATSDDTMAETENGYYTAPYIGLYYADKTNLGTWLPVCSKADCKHDGSDCDAHMYGREFVIKDNRIFYLLNTDNESVAGANIGNSFAMLVSMAADGSDKKMEFSFDEVTPTTTKTGGTVLSSQRWFYTVVEMDANGNNIAHSYMASASGWKEIATEENYEGGSVLSASYYLQIYGDKLVMNRVMDNTGSVYFRYNGDEAEAVDLTGLSPRYGYLSGDTLRFFRINDGYYDVNIKTGEEMRLADAQLENSNASIVLPNCIIESTLMAYLIGNNADHYVEGTTHEMRLFDGESWRSVELPEELVNANGKTFVRVQAVTSDSIIFFGRDLETYKSTHITSYYKIDLTQEELTLEHFYDYTY